MSSPGSQNRPAEDRQKGAVLGACPWPHWWAGSGRDLAEIPGCASLGVGWSCDELAPTQSCPLVPTTVMTSVPLNQSPGLTPWPSLAAPQSGTEVPAPLWRVEYSLGGPTLLPKLPEGGGAMQGGWTGLGYACSPGEGTHERSRPVGTPNSSRSQASARPAPWCHPPPLVFTGLRRVAPGSGQARLPLETQTSGPALGRQPCFLALPNTPCHVHLPVSPIHPQGQSPGLTDSVSPGQDLAGAGVCRRAGWLCVWGRLSAREGCP